MTLGVVIRTALMQVRLKALSALYQDVKLTKNNESPKLLLTMSI